LPAAQLAAASSAGNERHPGRSRHRNTPTRQLAIPAAAGANLLPLSEIAAATALLIANARMFLR
jgi:hypothetical protein